MDQLALDGELVEVGVQPGVEEDARGPADQDGQQEQKNFTGRADADSSVSDSDVFLKDRSKCNAQLPTMTKSRAPI